MARYVVQSSFTGAFLAPNLEDGQPRWVMLLRDAFALSDFETAAEMIADHVDPFHRAQIVDLAEV